MNARQPRTPSRHPLQPASHRYSRTHPRHPLQLTSPRHSRTHPRHSREGGNLPSRDRTHRLESYRPTAVMPRPMHQLAARHPRRHTPPQAQQAPQRAEERLSCTRVSLQSILARLKGIVRRVPTDHLLKNLPGNAPLYRIPLKPNPPKTGHGELFWYARQPVIRQS